MASRRSARPDHVTVVSKNPDTLDRLQEYFDASGVAAHGTRWVRKANAMIAPATTAVVLFPDEFSHADVVALITELRRTRPRVLLVIVTREPRKLEPVLLPDGRSVPPLVLPKPSFGWSILDAIRARGSDVTP
jgi:hypothetical protein